MVGSYDRFLLRRLGLFSGTNHHGRLRKGISKLRGGPTCSMVNQRPGARCITRDVNSSTKAPRKTVKPHSLLLFYSASGCCFRKSVLSEGFCQQILFGICLPNGCCFIKVLWRVPPTLEPPDTSIDRELASSHCERSLPREGPSPCRILVGRRGCSI